MVTIGKVFKTQEETKDQRATIQEGASMETDQATCNAEGIFDKLEELFEKTVNDKNTTTGHEKFRYYNCQEGRIVVQVVPDYMPSYVDYCKIDCYGSASHPYLQVSKDDKKLRITPSWHGESAQCRLSIDEDGKERSVGCDGLWKAVRDFIGSPLFL